MRYLVELVFGIGFFGLGAIALTFFLRFLLLTGTALSLGAVTSAQAQDATWLAAPIGTLRSVGRKHGRWLDTVLMQLALGDGDETAPEVE